MPERAPRRRLLRQGALAGLGLRSALIATGQLTLDLSFAHAATVLAMRVWPSPEYTRIALELDAPLKATQRLLAEPPRLIIDMEGLDASADRLAAMMPRQRVDDPTLAAARFSSPRVRSSRLEHDLRPGVTPDVFSLPPVASYRHRLVIDLYPATRHDPLRALLEDRNRPPHDPLGDILADRSARDAGSRHAAPDRRGSGGGRGVFTIAIDAGHGGEDPGAIGPMGPRDQDGVLAIAQHLHARISAQPGLRSYMTRTGDYFVPLGQRVARARRVRADLLVSIHADAYIEPHARGASVYMLSERGASSSSARWLAERENGADQVGGINLAVRDRELRRVLLDLSTTAQIRDSAKLAGEVLTALEGVGRIHKREAEQAAFAVLKAPDIPSILVETAFISNPEEERRLADPRHQQRLAEAIFSGIEAYLIRHAAAPPPPAA
ncbi:MAG: N-acetylmuramoyl-L-alanine amidase [Betaproteobacteria bacterium]